MPPIGFVPVNASNPYLDFATLNKLDYGDVLNYVGILNGEDQTHWHKQALINLSHTQMEGIEDLKIRLEEYYFKKK